LTHFCLKDDQKRGRREGGAGQKIPQGGMKTDTQHQNWHSGGGKILRALDLWAPFPTKEEASTAAKICVQIGDELVEVRDLSFLSPCCEGPPENVETSQMRAIVYPKEGSARLHWRCIKGSIDPAGRRGLIWREMELTWSLQRD